MPLQFLSETGIVGFLLYAAVVAAAVMGILRRERTRAWLALSLAVALCFVHSWVDIDWDFIAVQGPLLPHRGSTRVRLLRRLQRLRAGGSSPPPSPSVPWPCCIR